MRPIGQLETEKQARTFEDYLFVRDIETQVELASSGAWTVWVVDEERVDESKALLSRFRSMPDAEEFHQASKAATQRRQGEQQTARVVAKKLKRPGAFPWQMGRGGFTLVLLILCVAAALATRMGTDPAGVSWLQMSLVKIEAGQVWRLFTPIFLHFTLWHLVFNLLWMQDLGMTVESRIGTWRFAGVVALVALVSNGVQYATGGAGFGGMSGVVYGLFGYLWIRGKRETSFAGLISPMTSGLLLVFLALGVFGLVGPTANAAHFSGLLMGGGLGWIAARRRGGEESRSIGV